VLEEVEEGGMEGREPAGIKKKGHCSPVGGVTCKSRWGVAMGMAIEGSTVGSH